MQSAAKIVSAYAAATWAAQVIRSQSRAREAEEAWQVVHRKLARNAGARAQLDADELDLLVEAERLRIWRPLGMVSMLDYMERVLGYGPETAQKRLRVARSLRELPVLREALRAGELSFSAVRELSRVATAATETAWRDDARGKNLRQIEQKVAQHQRGDLPSDPPDPQVRWHDVTWRLDGEAFAILRQTRQILDEEHGRHLEPSELVKAMGRAVIDGGHGVSTDGRATHQIALVVCERCQQGWQHGAGVPVPIDAATVERAECNAQHVGSLHADVPARAHQDVPPSIVRLVWLRDEGRCQTPGCRSTRGLELHHIVRRADGGTHEPSNLTLFVPRRAPRRSPRDQRHRTRPAAHRAADLGEAEHRGDPLASPRCTRVAGLEVRNRHRGGRRRARPRGRRRTARDRDPRGVATLPETRHVTTTRGSSSAGALVRAITAAVPRTPTLTARRTEQPHVWWSFATFTATAVPATWPLRSRRQTNK